MKKELNYKSQLKRTRYKGQSISLIGIVTYGITKMERKKGSLCYLLLHKLKTYLVDVHVLWEATMKGHKIHEQVIFIYSLKQQETLAANYLKNEKL